MKNIKILGSGCANCQTTYKLIDEAARAAGVEVELEKVEDMPTIMGFGVMSTPGVVVDGVVVHAGGIPDKSAIEGWLADSKSNDCCSAASSSSDSGCCG